MIVSELGAAYVNSIFVELESLLLFSVLFVEVPKRSCNVCATNVGAAVGIDSVTKLCYKEMASSIVNGVVGCLSLFRVLSFSPHRSLREHFASEERNALLCCFSIRLFAMVMVERLH